MGGGLSVEHQSATVARHLSLFLGGNNLNLVCSQAEKLKSVSGCRPNVVTVLTDTTCEDEKINPAQKSSVRADYLANGDGKNFQRKNRPCVIGLDALLESLYVTLSGRKSEKAALMVEKVLKRVRTQLLVAQKIKQHSRIDVAGPGAHRNATRGREPHSGVDRHSTANSAEAGSVTEMREDGSLGKLLSKVMDK